MARKPAVKPADTITVNPNIPSDIVTTNIIADSATPTPLIPPNGPATTNADPADLTNEPAAPEVKAPDLNATIAALLTTDARDKGRRTAARAALIGAIVAASGADASAIGRNIPQDIGSFFRVLAGLDSAPDTARDTGTKDAEKRGVAAAGMAKSGDAGVKAAAKYHAVGTAGAGAAAYMIGRLAHGRAATAADGAALTENVNKVTGYRSPVKARE